MAGSLAEVNKPNFAGLNAQSIALWRIWLKYYEADFSSFDYNVRVGQGIQPPAYLTDQEKALWKALTQKRIDVVAHRYDSDWIIEIMERPGLATVGQIIGYNSLGRKYLTLKPTVRLALICARLGHDMAGIFKELGVLVFFFAPGKPPSFPPEFEPGNIKPASTG